MKKLFLLLMILPLLFGCSKESITENDLCEVTFNFTIDVSSQDMVLKSAYTDSIDELFSTFQHTYPVTVRGTLTNPAGNTGSIDINVSEPTTLLLSPGTYTLVNYKESVSGYSKTMTLELSEITFTVSKDVSNISLKAIPDCACLVTNKIGDFTPYLASSTSYDYTSQYSYHFEKFNNLYYSYINTYSLRYLKWDNATQYVKISGFEKGKLYLYKLYNTESMLSIQEMTQVNL